MKRLFFFVLVLTLLSFVNSYADTTWVEREVSGTWSTDGSPYILTGQPEIWIAENDTLIIEPGVEVLFEHYHGLLVEDATLIAEGTADDSIFFRDIDERSSWSQIWIYGNSDFSASFCEFRLKGGGNFNQETPVWIFGREITATFSHCTFTSMYYCLESNRRSDVSLTDCYFGRSLRDGFSLVQRCVIYGIMDRVYHGEICNNWSGAVRVYGETSVFNNILVGHRTALSGIDENVRYNCFRFNDQEFENVDIEGIGILDRVNANGDSTDRYGNLFQDPLQVGPIDSVWIFPDSYYLTSESPCIDAGDPESDPDPDGTRADIGAFFFPQQNIAVEPDSLEFSDIQTGIMDSIAVTIHNIGLDTLEVDSLFITQEGDIFGIGLGGCEFFLEPDSTLKVWVIFSPVVQAQYEAVLTIASNDRDQNMFEIPITGSALSVADESIDIPEDFVLFEAYPNPFNASTAIRFDLADPGHVRVIIFDQLGRTVKTLCSNQLDAGRYTYSWMGTDNNGAYVNSGVYFCRVSTGKENDVIKMVVIK